MFKGHKILSVPFMKFHYMYRPRLYLRRVDKLSVINTFPDGKTFLKTFFVSTLCRGWFGHHQPRDPAHPDVIATASLCNERSNHQLCCRAHVESELSNGEQQLRADLSPSPQQSSSRWTSVLLRKIQDASVALSASLPNALSGFLRSSNGPASRLHPAISLHGREENIFSR